MTAPDDERIYLAPPVAVTDADAARWAAETRALWIAREFVETTIRYGPPGPLVRIIQP